MHVPALNGNQFSRVIGTMGAIIASQSFDQYVRSNNPSSPSGFTELSLGSGSLYSPSTANDTPDLTSNRPRKKRRTSNFSRHSQFRRFVKFPNFYRLPK